MSDKDIEQIRTLARQLAERAKTDPGFKSEIEKDPTGTLTAAGLPAEAVNEFLREAQLTEVAGYAANTDICLVLSCIIATI